MTGMSNSNSHVETFLSINIPPIRNPTMMDVTVSPSIQPLATTSFSGGSNSVTMPYFAGEYAAAPNPITA